ncbi:MULTISPECIES: CDP-alcohol phosphatidyltransferase family protein [Sphingomonadales]|uniref:CDP-diacylglycerol O-phosphatidyltransferase n=2 Tax=Edaphosphingomonas TaxID=3423724 RepID=A0A2T4HW58_9SPHN|nr:MULTISPECIES: phosphatidylcholine/phosphatidylserine synthase [Sphingomonas]AGH48587.1 CDP-alcohol phosphatidyltransferase [Sphingomonas sp. MM-1]MDX3883234.1 phosphatidylcholine/phosphatidylserine synthase [Sphingomonas sp.]OHT21064.1 CDP-alcohol phosphatidyltransferase [Sphingomonas haloaromaticamans]PTD20044.1 CDP-diacylglycerol O-phosphatidyltransferase [Sphingomonas fennica]
MAPRPDNARIQRPLKGIPLRALAPNAVTALALCSGLTGVRFAIGAIGRVPGSERWWLEWQMAAALIILAGVLDGLDGRIARLLKGESRFGAELDSLSDVIAFGVSPAIIMFLWSLQALPRYGWLFALGHAVCCALRLARFNAQIDASEQPHKSAGFLTGVPAPAGAGLLMLPLYLWLCTGLDIFRETYVVAPWAAFVGFLLISNVATYSWSSLRLRSGIRLWLLLAVALLGAALIVATWETLAIASIAYVLSIPFGMRSYARVRRQRAAAAARSAQERPAAEA